MGARVTRADTGRAAGGDVRAHDLVPPEAGSELTLRQLELGTDASHVIGTPIADTLLFVAGGTGSVERDGQSLPLATGSSVLVPAGSSAGVAAGADGLAVVEGTVGPACDLHAPMGPTAVLAQLDHVEPGKATGSRSFQVLFDAGNGSTRATLFVGHIPPGKAPWHYHLYDEIVWVVAGEGRLHLGDTVEELGPGSAFRLHPREVHIVENTRADRELSVLGLFTPAGSPSAAYLEPDVFATYTAG
ncbi:MAG: cupin domain-containing protein [Actinobacteria bacterium]|nr:cupin domain-containing protein [Actinomycetota bacterium]